MTKRFWGIAKAAQSADPVPEQKDESDRLEPLPIAASNRSQPLPTGPSRSVNLGPLSPPRERDEAARQFVRWLQENGFFGDIGWSALPNDTRRAGILDYYADHCIEEHTKPVRPITLARALGRLAARGVIAKRQDDIGGRTLTIYWIPDTIDRYWINQEGTRNAEDTRSH
jgi:hypothetical protein